MRGILHDVTRCVGCMKCVEQCSLENHLVENGAAARYVPGRLSSKRFTTLERTGNDTFVRKHCLHCVEPACAAACLVGALHQTPEGPVLYDADKCIGCRYCMLACPFEAVKYEWEKALPYVKKCEMCYDRPGGPACVEACPHGATHYREDRDELIRLAERLHRENPGRYHAVDGRIRIWGREEMGGTCVMFIAGESLDDRWPLDLGSESIPDRTWPVAKKTPFLALGVASFLTATAWIIGRRNRLAAERDAAERTAKEGDEGGTA